MITATKTPCVQIWGLSIGPECFPNENQVRRGATGLNRQWADSISRHVEAATSNPDGSQTDRFTPEEEKRGRPDYTKRCGQSKSLFATFVRFRFRNGRIRYHRVILCATVVLGMNGRLHKDTMICCKMEIKKYSPS